MLFPGFTVICHVFIGFYLVLQGLTGFDWVLPVFFLPYLEGDAIEVEVADAGNGGRMRRRMAGGFISARPASLIAGAVFRTPTAAPGATRLRLS